jgi:DNA mismatch repair protein MutL
MPKINVLPPSISELIAAGEVIERPSSIVKELIENGLDAGATVVKVEISRGGIERISVSDNGTGIPSEDLPTAFVRHATSKIATKEDIDNIHTLGFRGEALASVCAVSRTSITSRTPDSDLGYNFSPDTGELSEVGAPIGTMVLVEDLFYNIPARLKFLKRDTTEGTYIQSICEKLALSNPSVSFTLTRDGKRTLFTDGSGSLMSACAGVLGKDFAKDMLPVDTTHDGVRVYGFVCRPMAARPNRLMQTFFVCGRYVHSRAVAALLEEAYRHSIMIGKFPSCVLFIDVPPSTIDVNIHPQKSEVRFQNEKAVKNAVYYAVKSAIETSNDLTVNQEPFTPPPTPVYAGNSDTMLRVEQPNLFAEIPQIIREKPENVDGYFKEGAFAVNEPTSSEFSFINSQSFQSSNDVKELTITQEKPDITVLGELFETYILAQVATDFVMIDKHAAHEKILYERFRSAASSQRQLILIPATVAVSPIEAEIIRERRSDILSFGFDADMFGQTEAILREVPSIIADGDYTAAFLDVVTSLSRSAADLTPKAIDEIYHSIACKAAIKAHGYTSKEEMKSLVEKVYYNNDIRYCPHGRPAIIAESKYQFEKRFGRV